MVEPAVREVVSTDQLAWIKEALGGLSTDVGDGERVDQIRLLEEIKAAAAGAQVQVTHDLARSQRAEQHAAGVAATQIGAGIASQVALAKREAPARSRDYVGWATAMVEDLPNTLAALRAGLIPESRAMIVARETRWLSIENRLVVDEQLALQIEEWGDRRVDHEVRTWAYRLDPAGAKSRLHRAESDRRVTLRSAPDAMSLLTGLLPVTQGSAVLAVLRKEASSRRAKGDQRTRGQIMADALVERVTGQTAADAMPVTVNLVMTDHTLFNDSKGDEPATVEGCGPVPADLARRLVLDAAGGAGAAGAWVRRLYTAPATGQLVAMDSRSRTFPQALAQFLVLRDQTCRTPWCDAPVRHTDHVVPAESGGATSEANGQGLCEACNYAKTAVGWSARPRGSGAGEEVEITTPSGHSYRSHPPDPPWAPPPPRGSPLEEHFQTLFDAA